MQTVKVEVDNEGKTKILYDGFAGEACFQEAQKLLAQLKAFGVDVKVEEVRRTADNSIVETKKQKVGEDG